MIERLENLLKYPICDNCLGRAFAQMLTGLTNAERGKIVRTFAAFLIEAGELKSFEPGNFQNFSFRLAKIQKSKRIRCYFCGGIFENLDKVAEKACRKLRNIEFETFLVGNKPSREMLEREEEMWKLAGLDFCEPLKAELNRELGKIISAKLKKIHDPKKPDVVILFDWESGKPKIELNVTPLYIFGYYQKLSRGFPQCKWGTPKKYRTSVEQIIAKPLLRETRGRDSKFHGCGREDIDARCLAWRAFVVEILHPRKRKVNLRRIAEEINASGRVKVKCLKFVERKMIEKIKQAMPDKTYRVLVEFSEPVTREELKKLKTLVGKIHQRTPTRVLHRRADKLRIKEVKKIRWKVVDKNKIELFVTCSAGLYVKELVTGDGGRTKPSVAELLGKEAKVLELDVMKIHYTEKW